jgi:hypothetical protein
MRVGEVFGRGYCSPFKGPYVGSLGIPLQDLELRVERNA